MRETTKQNLAILVITVLIAASAFIFINFIKPAINQREKLNLQIREEEQKLTLLKEYKAKFAELLNLYQSYGSEVELINQALPQEAQMAQVLATIDAISKKTGINLTGLNFSTRGDEKSDYGILSISTDFITNYSNLKTWLAEIETELRLTDLNKISIKTASLTPAPRSRATSSNNPFLQVSIDFSMYYQI
ncbi:MAG: type 4a pilus biogenesis protein PilO [Parcubacteria group bacterium]|nr:type 4a pilus biogenesis protein PilO [Parcubacteria group bacterium]